ncbi:MAG: vitamin transporter [Thermoanaerobaculia bacterium]|jgi:outer membrane cobalamin receptor|nr:vitamin transporter [Thermoanaerobaculia bacterium]
MRVFAALLLIGIAPLRADDPPKLKGEIVVTPERGAAERDAVAASVTVITREQLDKLPAQSLAEVVNAVPGITMDFDAAAAGAPMMTSRGFFGGGENEYVKLLVDGVPAGDVESGLIDWRHIRTADIERIEVLRGPGSSLYGDSAMGGVISVFTRGAAAGSGAQGEVRLSGGTLGTRDVDVNLRDDIGAFRLGIDALNASTDGYRDHSASRDRGGDLSLQHLCTSSRMQLLASLSSKDREEPGPLLATERAADRQSSNKAFRFDREQSKRRRLALSYDTFGTLPIRAVLHGSDRNTDFPRTLLLAPNFGSTLFRRIDTNNIGGIFEIAHDWKNASIRAGTDVDRASLRGDYAGITSTGSRGPIVANVNVHRNETAFFTTAEWQATERVRFSAGVRHDAIVDDAAPSKSAWSPRLGATFRLSPSSDANPIVAFIQLARAFKAPTLDQLFDPRPFPGPAGSTITVSNPSLLPQRARNAEVGVSRSSPATTWSISAYRMNVTDEIDFDPTFFTYRNIGSSRHTGVEVMADLRTTPYIQPLLTYAWTHVASTDNPGQQLKNIPEHVTQLYLRTTLPHSITATFAYRWEHTRFADDDGRFPLPDVHTVNARVARTFGRLRIDLDALNLFDAKYSYVASILNDFRGRPNVLEFPAPGRTARLTVAWKY